MLYELTFYKRQPSPWFTLCTVSIMWLIYNKTMCNVMSSYLFFSWIGIGDLIEKQAEWSMRNKDCLLKILQMKTSFEGAWGWDSLDMQPYKDASFHLRSSLYMYCMQACEYRHLIVHILIEDVSCQQLATLWMCTEWFCSISHTIRF